MYLDCGAQREPNQFGRALCRCLHCAGQRTAAEQQSADIKKWTETLLILQDFINIWAIMLHSLDSPVKPGKQTGIQWSERLKERERENQSKQRRNVLSSSCCSLLSHLPAMVCVITPQLKCLCFPVSGPRSAWWPHATLSTIRPGHNRLFDKSEWVSDKMRAVLKRKKKKQYFPFK